MSTIDGRQPPCSGCLSGLGGDLGGLGLVRLGSQARWDHLTGESSYGAQPESSSQQTDLA
jgi:hypothetical protein